jgi:hypothetical protein
MEEPAELERPLDLFFYFFADCTWWTPGNSDRIAGRPELREMVDLKSGRLRTPRHHGKPEGLAKFESVYRDPRPLPEWVKPE